MQEASKSYNFLELLIGIWPMIHENARFSHERQKFANWEMIQIVAVFVLDNFANLNFSEEIKRQMYFFHIHNCFPLEKSVLRVQSSIFSTVRLFPGNSFPKIWVFLLFAVGENEFPSLMRMFGCVYSMSLRVFFGTGKLIIFYQCCPMYIEETGVV